jgi:hypothetical protein
MTAMQRISRKDVEDSMVPLKATTFSSVLSVQPDTDKPTSIVCFTYKNKHDYLGTKFGIESENGYPILENESSLAYAKANYTHNVPLFFVKTDEQGFFYDPNGMHSSKIGRKGENMKWLSVTEESFMYYIQFLKTTNKQYLRLAMKEMQ